MWKKIIAFVMCVSLLTTAVGADYLLGYGDVWKDLKSDYDNPESKYYVTNDAGEYYITSDNKEIASRIGKVYLPTLSIIDQNGNTVSDKTTTLNVGDSQTYYVSINSSAAAKQSDYVVFYSSEVCSFYLDTKDISWTNTGNNASRSKSGNGITLTGVSVGKTRLVAEIPIYVIEYEYGEYYYEEYDKISGKPLEKKRFEEYEEPRMTTSKLDYMVVDAYINIEEKAQKTRPVPHNPFTGINLREVPNPFTDLSPTDWYYEAVMYLYAAGILNGVDFGGYTVRYNYFDNLAISSQITSTLSASAQPGFLPVSTLSASMRPSFLTAAGGFRSGITTMAVAIVKSSGIEGGFVYPENRANGVVEIYNGHQRIGYSISSYQVNPFNDVNSGMGSYQPILWASKNGIVNGYGNGKFGPDDHITREQFCAILVRHADMAGIRFKGATTVTPTPFTDQDKISSWAKNAVAICRNAGIIQGYEDGSFKPQGEIKRSELLKMVYTYFDALPE